MSTNNYQFNRARKLNRSARAESKQELGRYAGGAEATAKGCAHNNQWQSIATLAGGQDNFSRLKKSYATLRKSFRLQISSDHKREFDFSLQQHQQQQQQGEDPSGRRNLMGQLGSGAAKLLRGVYAKGQRAYNSGAGSNNNGSNELDSIRFTDGSFKVLSPTGHYDYENDGDGHYDRGHGYANDDDIITKNNNNNTYSSHKTLQLKKSMADLEIEQRLRRSRRRVLPSAKYQAPASDRACEGLNMEELEEIKRDNLRMTLLKTTTTTTTTTHEKQHQSNSVVNLPVIKTSTTTPHLVEPEVALQHKTGRLDQLEDSGEGIGVKLACSCKDVDDCAAEKLYFQHELDNIIRQTTTTKPNEVVAEGPEQDESQHYCTCASISSSFSSLDHLIEFENANHDQSITISRKQQEPSNVRPKSRASGGCGRSSRSSSIISNGSGSSSSSSSCGSGGDKIEDRLKAMFESMGHKLEFLGNNGNEEIDLELGNGCGHGYGYDGGQKLEMDPVNQQTACVRLSPKAEQTQQQHDTKNLDHQQQQQQPKSWGENIIKARDQANKQQHQQQQVANEMGEEEEDSSRSGCELLAARSSSSSLGGVNLIQNGQQVAGGGQQQVSGRSGSSGGGYCADGPANETMAKSNNSNSNTNNSSCNKAAAYSSYSPQPPLLKGYGAIELASNNNKQQQLVASCAVNTTSGVSGHQFKLLNAKQQIQSKAAARNQKQHLIKEEPKQNQDQNETLPEDHRQPNTNAEAKQDAAKLLKCVNTSDENSDAQTTSKDHHQQQQQQHRRPKLHQDQTQQQEVMNRMGDSCACRQGCVTDHQQQQQQQQKQMMMMACKQPAPEYPKEPTTMPCDDHLYASISDPLPATSPEQRARQSQFQGQEVEVDQNYHREWPRVDDFGEHDGGGLYVGGQGSFFDEQLKNDHDMATAGRMQQTVAYPNHHHSSIYDENSSTMVKQKIKRSLFGRLKDMIVPTGCRSNKVSAATMQARANCRGNEWALPHQPGDQSNQGDGNGTLKLDRRRQGCKSSTLSLSKWQKSATLTTRSTQNLIGSSFRYLSNSRKSINNDDDDYYYGGLANTKTSSRRPLTSYGFLTLGRRGNNHHHQLAMDQMFKNRLVDPRELGSRFAGSADSLPSADSGLSCSNLQTSGGSSDDTYASHHPNNNLYSGGPAMASGRRRPMVVANANNQQQLKQAIHHQRRRRVIGKAIAMVDCNPCAYDKEALVFKQGDTIDVLERNQTGTWVGHCNGQTGHFKFINVTELTIDNDDADHDDADTCEGDLSDGCGGRKQQQREQRNNGGVYVTKLEIRSNNNNNSDQIIKCKTGQELISATVATIDRRSKSMNMISQQKQQHQTTSKLGGAKTTTTTTTTSAIASHLSGGGSRNETIMSSLEQLLFAIGLASEQVNRKSQPKHGDDEGLVWPATGGGDDQVNGATQQVASESNSWSYLDVLNRGGINNLDSFSAIDDWHELEQIGIVDDEHQRRLLMAARIIRQASQAAKLDFVENYRHHNKCETNSQQYQQQVSNGHIQTHEKGDGVVVVVAKEETAVSPDTRNMSGRMQITDAANMLNNEKRECSTEKGDRSHSVANEPIYVNLVRGRVGPGFETNQSIVNGYRRVHGDGNLLLADKKNEQQHQQHELANRMVSGVHRRDLLPSCDHHRHHYNQAYSQTSPPDDGGEEMKINLINQSDHYRPLCAQSNSATLATTQETCLAESDGYYDDDYYYYDGDNDDDDSRRGDETSGHGQNKPPADNNNLLLNRPYSSSIVVREATCSRSGNGRSMLEECNQFINNKDLNHQRRMTTTTTAEVKTSSGGGGGNIMIDGVELSSPRHSSMVNSYHQLNCATAPMQPPQRRRIVPGGCDDAKFVTRKSNCDWPVTSQQQQQQQSSNDLQRPTIIMRNAGSQHTNDISSNLKSQINSKSAYDLRLDLSHFFS